LAIGAGSYGDRPRKLLIGVASPGSIRRRFTRDFVARCRRGQFCKNKAGRKNPSSKKCDLSLGDKF
jgi:hypothetical protein